MFHFKFLTDPYLSPSGQWLRRTDNHEVVIHTSNTTRE